MLVWFLWFLLNVLAIFLLMPIAVSRQVVECICKDGELNSDCMEKVSKFAIDVLEIVPDYYEKICLSDKPLSFCKLFFHFAITSIIWK